MGYRGGAPPWVYKNQLASQGASYESELQTLRNKIAKLEKENAELRSKVAFLENRDRT